MGTYRRKGHYRRSKSGNVHWVSPHAVTRSGSGYARRRTTYYKPRSTYTSPPLRPPRQSKRVRIPQPYSARWARPNATCPVCGALVYFWSNGIGSRVYFDEMGPPWPRHPCTDIRQLRASPAWSAPVWKKQSPTSVSSDGRLAGAPLTGRAFRLRYGVGAAEAFLVTAVRWEPGWTLIEVKRTTWFRRTLTRYAQGQFAIQVGQLVFVENGRLTYLEPVHLDVRQVQVFTPKQVRKPRQRSQ